MNEKTTAPTPLRVDVPRVSEEQLRAAIIDLLKARGADKTICPSEVARSLAGQDEKRWRLLMTPIRKQAVAMAHEGALVIKRKGKVVDPDSFKGVYRLGLPEIGSG